MTYVMTSTRASSTKLTKQQPIETVLCWCVTCASRDSFGAGDQYRNSRSYITCSPRVSRWFRRALQPTRGSSTRPGHY